MREIFLLFLLVIAGQWFAKMLRQRDARTAAQRNAASGASQRGTPYRAATDGARAPSPPPQLAEPMICCVECGVHAPKSESVMMSGQPFCCAAHAQRYHARTTAGRDAR
jgi:uncharacterized protein